MRTSPARNVQQLRQPAAAVGVELRHPVAEAERMERIAALQQPVSVLDPSSELDVDSLDYCKRGAFEHIRLAEIELFAVRDSHLVDELVLVEVDRMIATRRERRGVADIVV